MVGGVSSWHTDNYLDMRWRGPGVRTSGPFHPSRSAPGWDDPPLPTCPRRGRGSKIRRRKRGVFAVAARRDEGMSERDAPAFARIPSVNARSQTARLFAQIRRIDR